MQELYAKKDEIEALLMQEVETFRRSGIKYAENEAEYRKAVRVETLKERAKGTAVGLTNDLVRGLDYVADLKQASMSAEALYESSKEYINVLKIRLRMVNDEITRAWNSGGYSENGGMR